MISKIQAKQELNAHDIQSVKKICHEAAEHDVTKIITIGTDVQTSGHALTLSAACPDVYATVGIHPCDIVDDGKDQIRAIKEYISAHREQIVAIGECGYDLHHDKTTIDVQRSVFQAQIELALEHNLPLAIHSRKAIEETLRTIDTYKNDTLTGVIHCFSGDLSIAREVIDKNFLLGIGGPITYPKNDDLRHVFTTIPQDTFILETDAPFLAPQIIRGKPNHPQYVQTIAEYIANLREMSYEDIAQATTENAQRLFKL
jgi:TatD DNase family protein